MKKQTQLMISVAIILTLILSGCNLLNPSRSNLGLSANDPQTAVTQPEIEEETEPTTSPLLTSSQEETSEPTVAPENAVVDTEVVVDEEIEPADINTPVEEADEQNLPATVGPNDFPEGINPLTGLPADNPDFLKLPPALVSISNFPASGRPQAGINSSPIVFEMTIGEGMTRYLAMFYGKFPEIVSGQTEGQPMSDQSDDSTSNDQPLTGETASIGPIRSGRLPYEPIRSSYTGFLVMASAYSGVAQSLSQTTSIFGSDSDDISSAMINVNQLQQIAESQAEGYPGSNFSLEGMKFSTTPPEGGQIADQAWVFYSSLNQIQWRYDQSLGAYIRYDIKTDGSGEFVMATDRLTGEPVSRENVVILFAEHNFIAPTMIDIALINKPPMRALLFRDGEMHEIFWTTKFGRYEQETGLLRPIRFVDAEGNPISLKHGNTWVNIVTTATTITESIIRDAPFHPIIEEKGTGLWLVRYRGLY